MSFQQLFLFFEGRINRKTYWSGTLSLSGMSIGSGFIAQMLDQALGAQGEVAAVVNLFVGLPLIWFQLAVGAKRWHDRDKSAWWLLLYLLPIVGWVWIFVELGFLVGTVGENRFGSDPNADPYQLRAKQRGSIVHTSNLGYGNNANQSTMTRTPYAQPEQQVADVQVTQLDSTITVKLTEAKKLLDDGILSTEEYTDLKKRILQGF